MTRIGARLEDLQLKAVGLLRTSEAVRERYREQFSQLMVDEFQDTNSLQLSLIEQLHAAANQGSSSSATSFSRSMASATPTSTSIGASTAASRRARPSAWRCR